MIHFFKSFYPTLRLFFILMGIIAAFILGSFFPVMILVAKIVLALLAIVVIVETIMLYRQPKGLEGFRDTTDRFSNGDENNVYIPIKNNYGFHITLEVIDEVPYQFQIRDKSFTTTVDPQASTTIRYHLKPSERGVYTFGFVNCYVSLLAKLIQRRYQLGTEQTVAVYPSYLQLKKYAFLAFSNQLQDAGIKRIRKIGHTYEFDQIRDFIQGDDHRSINWNATARSAAVKVNQYQDEKSQDIYAVINKGRVMKMPFDELTLLDHAINSTLVMLNTAYQKDDNLGLVTFNKSVEHSIQAARKEGQMQRVLETLYRQETDFSEADYTRLYLHVREKIKKRSLLFLYTNFESMSGLKREIKALRQIAHRHLLVVVFFKNTELDELTDSPAKKLEDIYVKTVAIKFKYEKELIVKELKKYGIDALLTTPSSLTVDSVNKYLELKARQMI